MKSWRASTDGDDIYTFFELEIFRCNQTSQVQSDFAFHDAWTGRCASDDNITDFLKLYTSVNVWFRFQREDWEAYRTLQPPKGTGSGKWTWCDRGAAGRGESFILLASDPRLRALFSSCCLALRQGTTISLWSKGFWPS